MMEDQKLIIQEATGFLRTAERSMFGGKNQEAVDLLNKADDLATKAASIIPDDFQLKSLLQKIEKMRRDLERKGIATRTGGKKELPFDVNAQLLRIKECVVNGNSERAEAEMKSYFARFAGPYSDIPEIKELQTLIGKLKAEEAEKQKREAGEAQVRAEKKFEHELLCDEWRQKLGDLPYFDGRPQSIPDLTAHYDSYSRAVQVLNNYSAVTFSEEPDYTLQSLAAEIKRRVEAFKPVYLQTVTELAGQIQRDIESSVSQLKNDIAWKTDATKLPGLIGDQGLNELKIRIEELRVACRDENIGIYSDLMMSWQQLVELNEEYRKFRASAVRMKPEVKTGAEAETLKEAAISELLRTNPGIVVLKAAVTRDWESRFEEGWEDTSRTKWVKRLYHDATVQVAARQTDGLHKLFHMNVDETQISEGVYGNTKSHVMYSDAIDPLNI